MLATTSFTLRARGDPLLAAEGEEALGESAAFSDESTIWST